MSSQGQPRRTVPSERTRAEEARANARVPSGDRREPDEDDEPRSEPPPEVDEEVAENYREMIERGADQKGEGRLP